jgi:hypothetical protein
MQNPICDICNKPVKLETSRTDEHGKAVHEGCYLLKISLKRTKTPKAGEDSGENNPTKV